MGDAAFELERVEWRWGRAAHLCLVEPLCLRDGTAGDEGEGEGHEAERTPRRGRVLAVHENLVAAVLAKAERAGEPARKASARCRFFIVMAAKAAIQAEAESDAGSALLRSRGRCACCPCSHAWIPGLRAE